MLKQNLQDMIGALPKETGFKKRARFHQGWWRTFILAEKQGQHPIRKVELIGSSIQQGEINGKNFLSENIRKAVRQTIQERQESGSGIMEEERLFNNLLSSQPLCFNFFGELKIDKDFALHALQRFYPEITAVRQVVFEYAPEEKYTHDNSAFDVAFEVEKGDAVGLIGFEAKYTDTFSQREYDKPEYRDIYKKSALFNEGYTQYVSGRYNQLFRNQLMAEAMLQNKKYNFVYTGLFCHHADQHAVEIGEEFKQMLVDQTRFTIITYQNYIEELQQLPLSWNRRELTMMLWARYCATQLSGNLY